MPLRTRPLDCLFLRFKHRERMIGMIFNSIPLDSRTFGAALGACFDINNWALILSRSASVNCFRGGEFRHDIHGAAE